ncbi:accessory gene regulator ArgB-like protein [Pelotomaculum propionicicum]|uniref:Accessory gene regulator protein B n=1 Tax=Pelotomaculum propionicicum TaxID=258475 RepID=A0A4Y7RRF2_9FIRM|nr:accessory gene regulator B family protein [Pelotomaculum propionicicum]NLI11928.1 accessory gene regulator B family protein [Peptococcaceae bacterium]TEB11356.1 Accessory gene regulator protein B [Pelotomaculum propionicicum]
MSYLAFSKSAARFLTEKTGLSPEKEVVLAYSIELLALNLGNILFTLLLAALLGVLPGVLSCLAAAFLFRHTAGGAHSNSPWRCAAVTIAVYPAMALLAVFLSQYGQTLTGVLAAAALLTGLVTLAVLAPVDSPAAPIISPHRRKKLKVLSFAVLASVAAAIFFFRRSDWLYAPQIQVCLALSVLWVSFMLGKPGHRLMCLVDRIKIREVRNL